MPNDDLDVRIQTIVEADIPGSVSKIKSQIPSIESGLKGQTIKLPMEVDATDVTRVVKQAVDGAASVAKSTKVTIPVGINFNFDLKNQEAIRAELQRVVSQLTQNKGELSSFKIDTSGTDRARKVLLTYKNEAQETIKQVLQLKRATTALAPDRTKAATLEWKITNSSYEKDLQKIEAAKTKIEDYRRKLEIFKEETPANLKLDYDKINGAFDEGNIKKITAAYKELVDQRKLANAKIVNSMPDTAIENLPKRISDVNTQLTTMGDKFQALQAKGAIVSPETFSGIQLLSERLKSISSAPMDNNALEQFKSIQVEANNLANTLKTVESSFNLQNALNDTQKLQTEVKNVQQTLLNMKTNWSAAFKNPELATEWERLWNVTESGAIRSKSQLSAFSSEVTNFSKRVEGAGLNVKTLFGRIWDLGKKFGSWLLLGNGIVQLVQGVKEVFSTVSELNQAYTDLRIVTNGTNEQTIKLLDSYTQLGKKLGATTKEIASAASDWLRQGKSTADTAVLVQDSMVLSKVANIDPSTSTELLTSAMKGYGVSVSEVIDIIDKLTSVDLISASSAGGLAQAMAEVANGANLAGVSMSKLIGYIAAVKEVTQQGDSEVGHAFSSMFARMSNIKLSRLKSYQNGDEDLSNTETVLRGLGIKLRDSTKEFRPFSQVLDDVAARWSKFSSVQQRALASAFSPKQNMESFLTLMNNYSRATEYATVAETNHGTALQKMAIYEKSVEASQKRLTASFEEFSGTVINSDLIKFGYDSGSGILGFLTETIKLLGTIPTIATAASAAMSFKNIGVIQQTNQGNILPFWKANKANKLDQVKIDATSLENYAAALENNTDKTTAMNVTMSKASDSARRFAVTTNVDEISIKKFADSQEASIKSTSKFSLALKGLGAVAKNIGISLLNAAIGFAASFAIEKVVEGIDYLIRKDDIAIQKSKDLAEQWKSENDSLNDKKKSLDNIADEYIQLSKGVDTVGNRASLTANQFARYNELSNQIADLFPDLVSGWTSEGNAILKVKGNLEGLTDAYKKAKAAQDAEILKSAPAALEGAGISLFKTPNNLLGGNAGAYTQSQLIKSLFGSIGDPEALKEAYRKNIGTINQILSGAGIDQPTSIYPSWATSRSPFISQLEDEAKAASFVNTINDNAEALRTYEQTLDSTMSSAMDIYKQTISAYLDTSEIYSSFSDDTKSVVSSVLNNLLPQDFEQFYEKDINQIYKWTKQNIISKFGNLDLSDIVSFKSLFDSNKISLSSYQSAFDRFKKTIISYSPEIQKAFEQTFSPNTDELIEATIPKLSSGIENLKSLSLDKLTIAANLKIDDGTLLTWDQLIQKIKEAQATAAQGTDSLGQAVTSIEDQYKLLNTAMGEQGENGAMSYETYTKLITANAQFADAISVVDGKLQINSDKAYAVADAYAKLQQSEAEAGAAATESDLDKNSKDLEDIANQMERLNEIGKGGSDTYNALADQREQLEAQRDILEAQLQQYEAITAEIQSAYTAYSKFKAAQKTPNHGDTYNAMRDDVYGAIKTGLDTKQVNSDDYKSALDMFLGTGNYDNTTREGLTAAGKKAKKLKERYLTKDPLTGLGKFQKDLLDPKKMGELSKYFSKDKNGNFTIADGVTAEQIAKQLGMGPEMLQSLFDMIKLYDPQAKMDDLYKKLFPEPTTDTTKTDTPVSQATTQYESDVTNFEKKATEWSTRLYSAEELMRAALEGKTPPTPTQTPTPPSNGGGTSPTSSVENRKNEGISPAKPTQTVVVTPIPQQTVDLVLNVSTEELARISGIIKTGVDGEIPITADPTEASTALTALGLEIQNLPGATVTVSLVDPNGAVKSVSSLSDAIALIKQGAAANISVSFNPADSSGQVSALGDDLDKVNQGANAIVTTDTGDSQAKIQAVTGDLDNVQDKTPVIDADTSYIPGDVSKANAELDKTEDKTSEITADASSIPDTISAANAEIAKLQGKTVTVTTIYKTEGDSSGGGGSGGKGVNTDNSGSSTDTSKDSGGKSGGAGGGRKSGLSSSSDSQAVPTDNVKEADAQLNPLLALLLSIKNAWDNLWNRGPVPDLIEPTGIDNLNTAKGTLDDIQNENIDPKKMSLDPQTAYSQNYVLEQRLGQSVTKIVKIKTEEQSNAKGTKNAKPGISLVDEEGAEVIEHADGTYEIGTDQGPRLTILQKGDVVHTAEETKGILRRGIDNVRGFFGRRFESGWNLPTGGGGGNSSPNTSSSKKNTSVDWKKYIDRLFDWIDIRLKRLQSTTDKWKRQIEDAVGYLNKNKAIDSTISAMNDQINALNAASQHYEEQAATVAKKTGLNKRPDIIAAIQNGTIDISSYSADAQKKIKEYQEWWEKAQDVKEQVEEIKDEQEELIHQKMDNIINQYKDLTDVIDAASEKAKANIEYKKATGKEVTAADYQPEINAQVQKIATMQDEYNKLKAEFDKQLADGTLVKGSEAYYQYLDQLNDLDTEIINSKTDLAGLNDEVRQLALTNLNNVLNNFKAVQSSIQGTLDLIQAQGRIVTTDVYKQLIQNGMQQIANLQQQNDLLKQQQQGLDKNSDKYQEIQQQLDSNAETINGIKVSQEEWNDSILDLRIDELNRMKDALSKTNDEYERQKDLQQAIEDLERAKSQRKIRVLENGEFKYVADTQDVADKQRALDQKLHEEDMAQIDKVIDAIEDLKESNNVYADQGLSKTTLNDLFPGATLDDILQGVLASAKAGVSLAELADTMSSTATALMQTNNRTSSVTVAPNAVNIYTTEADPAELTKYMAQNLATEIQTAFTQIEYE